MTRTLVSGIAALAALVIAGVGLSSWAEEDAFDPVRMARAMEQASVTLEQGLKASEAQGTPISAKFEVENVTLQLSVYTMKGGTFSEVIVDHKTGTIGKSEAITGGDDLKEAQAQAAAMNTGWIPLAAALGSALQANSGYRAVSIEPVPDSGHPVARIVLMKGQEVRRVVQMLY